MSKLNVFEYVVEKVLDMNEEARSNDDILYLNVCEHVCPGTSKMTLKDFLNTRSQSDCPTFASVTRLRRKVFEKRPDLKPVDMTKVREDAVYDYMNYALNG